MFNPYYKEPLWGEIPLSASEASIGLSSAEKEALIRMPRPLCLEGPKIYQPKTANVSLLKIKTEANPGQTDQTPIPLTRLGCQLQERLRSTNQPMDEDEISKTQEKLPAWSRIQNPFFKDYGGNVQTSLSGKRIPVSDIPRSNANNMLKSSAMEILACYGFQEAQDDALQCLTDACETFLQQFCSKLNEEGMSPKDEVGGFDAFKHAFDRSLADLSLPNVLELFRFYQNELLGHIQNLIRENSTWHESPPLSVDLGTNQSTNLYFVSSSAEQDIPEIHFPSSEEGGEIILDHTTPHLETGLQMLQSLEQGSLGSQPSVQAHVVEEDGGGPPSHDSNSALLLATVSPGGPDAKRRRK